MTPCTRPRSAPRKVSDSSETPGDTLAQDWHSFDEVRAGEVIAVRAGGEELRAPYHGRVLFPHPEADVGQELYYLAEPGG